MQQEKETLNIYIRTSCFKAPGRCEILMSIGPFPSGKRMDRSYFHRDTKHGSPGRIIQKKLQAGYPDGPVSFSDCRPQETAIIFLPLPSPLQYFRENRSPWFISCYCASASGKRTFKILLPETQTSL